MGKMQVFEDVREHLGKFSLSLSVSSPPTQTHTHTHSHIHTHTCICPQCCETRSSAVTAAAARGRCRTEGRLEPIGCQVVLSLPPHWHISFSSLFSRLSSALPVAPRLHLPSPSASSSALGLNLTAARCYRRMCVCVLEQRRRGSENRDGRRCAAFAHGASGRLGGQRIAGFVPVERGPLLSSTSEVAADEVPAF